MTRLTQILRCERGVNAIEYALVASLISVAALSAYAGLGSKVQTQFHDVDSNLGAHL